MTKGKQVGVGLVGLVLAAVAGCGTPAATGAGPVKDARPPVHAPVAEGGAETGHVLVSGRVLGTDEPIEVSVMLWPATVDGEVGEAVDTVSLPPVSADDEGRWAVDLDPRRADSRYLETTNRFVNFDVHVFAGRLGTSWSTSAWLLPENVWRSEGGALSGGVVDLAIDLVEHEITLTDSSGEATTSPLTVIPITRG